jgi:hypothetical protein
MRKSIDFLEPWTLNLWLLGRTASILRHRYNGPPIWAGGAGGDAALVVIWIQLTPRQLRRERPRLPSRRNVGRIIQNKSKNCEQPNIPKGWKMDRQTSHIFSLNCKSSEALKIAKHFFFIFSLAWSQWNLLLVTKCHLKLHYLWGRLLNPQIFSGLTGKSCWELATLHRDRLTVHWWMDSSKSSPQIDT